MITTLTQCSRLPFDGAGFAPAAGSALGEQGRSQFLSSFGLGIDPLYCCLWAVCACFVLLIVALIVYGVFRCSHPESDDHEPRESLTLEMFFAMIPFILAMLVFFWAAR
jgi:hypothetical protein